MTEPVVSSQPDLTVLCVKYGQKYGSEYVEKLRNMVSRHLTIPYEFACLTDDTRPIHGVRTIHQPNAGYAKGWWHKVHMFDPNLPISGRILYLDLDVVICNNLDKLVTGLGPQDFLGIRDFNRKFHPSWKRLNSSVMTWQHRAQEDIWNKFKANPRDAQKLHGDQDWIWQCAFDRLKFFPDDYIQSYKWEIRNRDDLIERTGRGGFRNISSVQPNPACCVAVFHGDPNPHDVKDPFVIDNWK